MKNKCIRYIITAKENHGGRREWESFKTKPQAKKELRKLLSPGKINKYGLQLTSYRDALSGTGINNPRIKKVRTLC